MELLDLTLPTIEENLALDEALLDEADEAFQPGEEGEPGKIGEASQPGLGIEVGNASAASQVKETPGPVEVLRLWEAARPAVVVGRASRLADEVDLDACRTRNIPVCRRASGGSAVVVLPGCLIYSLVLDLTRRPQLASIDRAHQFVLQRVRRALQALGRWTSMRGVSDLACGDLKVSGNSLRTKRRALLYHGTLLYGADLELIQACLRNPPRQPDYRNRRCHRDFLANLDVPADRLRAELAAVWGVTRRRDVWPRQRTAELVREKYTRPEWNAMR